METYPQGGLSLQEGCVILVNGRNIASLEKLETKFMTGMKLPLRCWWPGGKIA